MERCGVGVWSSICTKKGYNFAIAQRVLYVQCMNVVSALLTQFSTFRSCRVQRVLTFLECRQ